MPYAKNSFSFLFGSILIKNFMRTFSIKTLCLAREIPLKIERHLEPCGRIKNEF